jgi:hypothetical protein
MTLGLISFQSAEHDTADAPLQFAHRCRGRIACSAALVVIASARAAHADLGDRDAMDRSVELPVA